jgi:hypothetical protein
VNLWRISKWKTHNVSALAVRGSTTELAIGNDTAVNDVTLCIGDDCEVRKDSGWTNTRGICKM